VLRRLGWPGVLHKFWCRILARKTLSFSLSTLSAQDAKRMGHPAL
jgi:hypothetical protein